MRIGFMNNFIDMIKKKTVFYLKIYKIIIFIIHIWLKYYSVNLTEKEIWII